MAKAMMAALLRSSAAGRVQDADVDHGSAEQARGLGGIIGGRAGSLLKLANSCSPSLGMATRLE